MYQALWGLVSAAVRRLGSWDVNWETLSSWLGALRDLYKEEREEGTKSLMIPGNQRLFLKRPFND